MKAKLIIITLCILLTSCTNGDNNEVVTQGEEEVTVISGKVAESTPEIINNNDNVEQSEKNEIIYEKYEFTAEDYERFTNDLKKKTIEGDKEFMSYTYGMDIDEDFLEGSREFLEMTENTEFFYSCNSDENTCTKGGKEGVISGGVSHYYDKKLKMFFRKPFREKTMIKENKFTYLDIWRYNDEKDQKKVQVYVNNIDLKIDKGYGQSLTQLNQYLVKEKGNVLDLIISPKDDELENNSSDFKMSLTLKLMESDSEGEQISNEEVLKLDFSESDLTDGSMKKTISLDELLK